MWGDRANPSWSRSPLIRNHQGSSSCLRKKVRKSSKRTKFSFKRPPDILSYISDSSYDYNDLSFDSFDDGEESQSLPFSLKVILFTLVAIALILIVFSASVGAICRIQCKVGETGNNICRHKSQHNFLDSSICLAAVGQVCNFMSQWVLK